MKWNNKAHEFDEKYLVACQIFTCNEKIMIYGAGNVGLLYGNLLKYFDLLGGVFDSYKIGEQFLGYSVNSIESYNKGLIVICVSRQFENEVETLLNQKGYKKNVNYIYCEEFFKNVFPIVLLYEKNMIYMNAIQLSLTERCTLKCRKCAHACNYVPMNYNDLNQNQIKSSIDNIFTYVDYLEYFLLIGGEPLLSKNVKFAVEYIGRNYRNRIGRLQITTNGTIMPQDDLLELCRKYEAYFMISNYSSSIERLKPKYELLKSCLHSANVAYTLIEEEHMWTDYGFDHLVRENDDLEKVFDACMTECHEIREDKLYFCIMARSVSENKNLNIGKDDYYLLQAKVDSEEKRQFFEFLMGFSDKGYLDMCKYCYGAERLQHLIVPAEQ